MTTHAPANMEFEPEVEPEVEVCRHDLMEQLGLTEDDTLRLTSSSDSGSEDAAENADEKLTAGGDIEGHPTLRAPISNILSDNTQEQELRQMLRDTQRKLRSAQFSLTDSERNKERRIKIMRKSHQAALTLKQAVITELQDIIAEKEDCISQLQVQVSNNQPTNSPLCIKQCRGLEKLLAEVARLQKENLSLTSKNLEAESQMENLFTLKQKLQEDLFVAQGSILKSTYERESAPLVKQVRELQQKLLSVQQEKQSAVSKGTVEKELHHQLTELKIQVRVLQNEKENLQQEIEQKHEKYQAELESRRKIQADLKHQLNQLQSQLEHQFTQHSHTVSTLEQQLRDTTAKLSSEHGEHVCTVERLQVKLAISRKENMAAFRDFEKRMKDSNHERFIVKLKSRLPEIMFSTVETRQSIQKLKEAMESFCTSFSLQIGHTCKQICSSIADVSQRNTQLVGKYRREMSLRKKLHNQIVELRGNIRVLCRVRPWIREDGEGPQAEIVVEVDRDDDSFVRVLSKGSWKDFEVDKAFAQDCKQQEVFKEVEYLVTSCIDGYSVCIFAYGQTGSGKTYTMEGSPDNPGINQRTLDRLFDIVSAREQEWNYAVHVSLLEIYNESVRDLLCYSQSEKLELKQGTEGVYVPGLSKVQVFCLNDINKVLAHGHESRAKGATQMNIESSRSHALLCVTVLGENRVTGVRTLGKLNLIDLAGSERLAKSGSEGVRMLEAKHINKSLSALGDVIHSLRTKCSHIPYRNSKLTYLLSDSLSGDSKTLMMVQVSSVEKNVGETVCSLGFAQRVRAVELGQAVQRTIKPSHSIANTYRLFQGSPRLISKTPRSD